MTNSSEAHQNLAQQALKTLQAVCRGNGAKAASVKVESFKADMLKIPAYSFIELRPQTSEKKEKGKVSKGHIVSGKDDVMRTIDQTMLRTLRDTSARKQIANLLLKRPDQGFGFHNGSVTVDFLTNDFTWHEGCGACAAQGRSACPRCQGLGRETCPQCNGRTMVPCNFCRGSGSVNGQDGRPQPCSKCHGQRQMVCPMCQRTGKTPCRQCGSSGHMACTACGGTGWFSHVVHVTTQAVTHFDMDRGLIPSAVAPLIDKNAANLIQKGHIKVSARTAETKEDVLGLEYVMQFPYGDITFNVRGKPIKGSLFGFKARLLALPDFLDKLLAKGIKCLEEAAGGQGSVADKIHKSSRYRVIAHALLNAAQNSAGKTASDLLQKFPLGLSRRAAEDIAKYSDQAVARVTRKPRYVGLVIGLILVGGLYGFYYLGPGRDMISPYIGNPKLNAFVDLFLVFVGGTMTTLCIRLNAARSLQHALGHLVPPKDRKRLIPKARTSAVWGYAGGLMLYLVMVELTVHLSAANTPVWYQALRDLVSGF